MRLLLILIGAGTVAVFLAIGIRAFLADRKPNRRRVK